MADKAEEKGLLGARISRALPDRPDGIRITAAIDLDMPILLVQISRTSSTFGASHSTLDRVFATEQIEKKKTLSPDPNRRSRRYFTQSEEKFDGESRGARHDVATGKANGGDAAWSTFLADGYHQPSDDMSQPRYVERGHEVSQT